MEMRRSNFSRLPQHFIEKRIGLPEARCDATHLSSKKESKCPILAIIASRFSYSNIDLAAACYLRAVLNNSLSSTRMLAQVISE